MHNGDNGPKTARVKRLSGATQPFHRGSDAIQRQPCFPAAYGMQYYAPHEVCIVSGSQPRAINPVFRRETAKLYALS
jgi:hypothetical protein